SIFLPSPFWAGITVLPGHWRRTNRSMNCPQEETAASRPTIPKNQNQTTKMNEIKTNTKRTRQRGTTLIELSVVIAVILLLTGVLFIGVTAWKNGANRAACIVNLSSIQKAVRGYQNMNLLPDNAPLGIQTLTNAGFWQRPPQCPSG